MTTPARLPRETVPFRKRLEDKERRTLDQLGRLTRLHRILHVELRRLRNGEAEGVIQARLARYGVRV